jgi:hypothetical protein
MEPTGLKLMIWTEVADMSVASVYRGPIGLASSARTFTTS